ncbi:MAG: bifunctional precorrin-2 dehydrogenase/sirohydrochlorin ferrochelatase [Thermodesulforhabdaceae bacterium]
MYPVVLRLEGIRCLVIGGGQVGERKARRLVEEKAKVCLISREISQWFSEAVKSGDVEWIAREYHPRFLQGISIVFAATSDKELNSLIVRDALNLGLWCNSATNPQEGNLTLPAIFQKGKLVISVSTGGASPALASLIRDEISDQFKNGWEEMLECLDRLRKTVQELRQQDDDRENQSLFREIAVAVFHALKNEADLNVVKNLIRDILSKNLSSEEIGGIKQVLNQC